MAPHAQPEENDEIPSEKIASSGKLCPNYKANGRNLLFFIFRPYQTYFSPI
ncbi:hypothetical protein LJC11_03135 [Bacteroidales bacterium OttesenSCG-928-I21]|nr:hypothetical protein [Bacteroidales bacterium OttesenSCG-928-I21]